MSVTEYAVDDVLTLVRRPVSVSTTEAYEEIGVRSFGRGIFHKPAVSGAEIGNKKVFEIHPGELVFNTVFAWEGAVAITTDAEKDKIGSHRFMTYQVNTELADLRYLHYFFQSDPGLKMVGQASPGGAGRNRTLGIKAFGRQRIPLPDLAEQRRIADRLGSMASLSSSLGRTTGQLDTELLRQAERHLVDQLAASGWIWKTLDEAASINPRRDKVNPGEDVAFVPMSAVDDKLGVIRTPDPRTAEQVSKGHTQFRRGDIIFARITPCMQNGKSAIFRDDDKEYGYGSTEFHVIRPGVGVSPEWLHFWVRRIDFRREAQTAFTGTAGQQRVPASFLRGTPVLVPPSTEAECGALARAAMLRDISIRLRGRREHFSELHAALKPSLLNAAFSGQL